MSDQPRCEHGYVITDAPECLTCAKKALASLRSEVAEILAERDAARLETIANEWMAEAVKVTGLSYSQLNDAGDAPSFMAEIVTAATSVERAAIEAADTAQDRHAFSVATLPILRRMPSRLRAAETASRALADRLGDTAAAVIADHFEWAGCESCEALKAAIREWKEAPATGADTRRCADCGVEAEIHAAHRPGHPFRAPTPKEAPALEPALTGPDQLTREERAARRRQINPSPRAPTPKEDAPACDCPCHTASAADRQADYCPCCQSLYTPAPSPVGSACEACKGLGERYLGDGVAESCTKCDGSGRSTTGGAT